MWGEGWQGDEGVGVGGWVDYSLRENAPVVSPIQKNCSLSSNAARERPHGLGTVHPPPRRRQNSLAWPCDAARATRPPG